MPVFPLRKRPSLNYTDCPRAFGCPRSAGRRKHAGCDLYAPVGTEVLSVENGTIIQPVYFFYLDTYALEIKHESGIVIRYGEIQKNTPRPWKTGDVVKAGEVIGYIGRLKGLRVTMLHFELYAGIAKGPLTTRTAGGFQRREDLLDPTKFLDELPLVGEVS